MRFYIAASYSRREECQALMHTLEEHGHECTAHWLKDDHSNLEPEWRVHYAHVDLNDVRRAHVFISLTEPAGSTHNRGGRHVEFGYAYANNKRMIMIGDREENIFHYLEDLHWYGNAGEMMIGEGYV